MSTCVVAMPPDCLLGSSGLSQGAPPHFAPQNSSRTAAQVRFSTPSTGIDPAALAPERRGGVLRVNVERGLPGDGLELHPGWWLARLAEDPRRAARPRLLLGSM